MSSTSSGSVGRSVPKPPSKRYSMAKGVESSNRKKSGLKSMMIWQVIRKATGARHIKGSLASMAAKMLISRIPAPVNNNCFFTDAPEQIHLRVLRGSCDNFL